MSPPHPRTSIPRPFPGAVGYDGSWKAVRHVLDSPAGQNSCAPCPDLDQRHARHDFHHREIARFTRGLTVQMA